MSQTILSQLKADETVTLQRLLQLYYFESTTWSKEEIGHDGLYDGCTALDLESYINSTGAAAYIIRTNKNISGFVMMEKVEIEGAPIWELADLFVLPKYRSGWVALEVVRQIIDHIEQPILASTFKGNVQAFRFFRAVSKRLTLGSVREIIETDKPQLHSFIINEQAPQKAVAQQFKPTRLGVPAR